MLVVCLGVACGGEEAAAPSAPAPSPETVAEPPAQPNRASPAAAKAREMTSPILEKVRSISDIPTDVEDPQEAVKQLKPWLADENRDLREAAILALWDLETQPANQALANVAREESDPELKGYAVEELVDREAPEALEALLVVLNDSDTDLREQAAEGLEELEDPQAISGLYERLNKEEDEWVRDAIISALSTVDPDFDEDRYDE
jgi:HEAT repeat protein